jgi:hypothetical protein
VGPWTPIAPQRVYTLARVADAELDWPQLYARAVATGSGIALSLGEERVAADDELLSATPRELFILAELGAYASFPPLADDCRVPLQRTCAALIRLIDRALRAHAATSAIASTRGAMASRPPRRQLPRPSANLERTSSRCPPRSSVPPDRSPRRSRRSRVIASASPDRWSAPPANCSSCTPQPPTERPQERRAPNNCP